MIRTIGVTLFFGTVVLLFAPKASAQQMCSYSGIVAACGTSPGYFQPAPWGRNPNHTRLPARNPGYYYTTVPRPRSNGPQWQQYYPNSNSYGPYEPHPYPNYNTNRPPIYNYLRDAPHTWRHLRN